MLQDFSSKNILEDLREYRRALQECEKLKEAIGRAESDLRKKQLQKDTIATQNSSALVLKQKAGILSKIASLFHIGKYYATMKRIEAGDTQLTNLEKEINAIEAELGKLKIGEQALVAQAETKKVPKCVREEDGRVVITSARDTTCIETSAKEQQQVQAQNKVLVHCTNFFPKDNMILSGYDGNQIGSKVTTYRGVRKEISALTHRHEVHFTINARVKNTGGGEGEWNNPSYMIIDRYNAHEDEMESTSSSDAYTKGKSFKLSNDAVIMIRLQDKERLPISKEEQDKCNIIYYQGAPKTCLENFLILNNYAIFETDERDAGHANSERYKQEMCGNSREMAINFMRDNTYFSRELPVLSADEMAQLVDIGMGIQTTNLARDEQTNKCIKAKKIPANQEEAYKRVMQVVIGWGVVKTPDGKYTFKTDEEILEDIKEIGDSTGAALPGCIDQDLIYEIFQMQQDLSQKLDQIPRPSLEEIAQMSLEELYKFQNQLACETLQQSLPKDVSMTGKRDNADITIYGYGCEEMDKRVNTEDGISYVNSSADFYTIERSIPKSMTAANILREFEALRQKVEEIKQREPKEQEAGR